MQLDKSYWVDWDDAAFPAIRHRSHKDWAGDELLTLRQAKKAITKRAREERQHWLAVMNRTATLTPEKVLSNG